MLGELGDSRPSWARTPPGPSSRTAPEYGAKVLREAGWDGEARRSSWSVPSIPSGGRYGFARQVRWRTALTGAFKESHYRTVYFHNVRPGGGRGVPALSRRSSPAPSTPSAAAQRLSSPGGHGAAGRPRLPPRLPELLGGVPVFTSDDYDMYQLVSILRSCAPDGLLALPRHRHLHAGAGALGRRHHGRAHPQPDARARPPAPAAEVDDPELEPRLSPSWKRCMRKDAHPRRHRPHRRAQLKVMARMGVYFEEHVQRRYPDFPCAAGCIRWEDYSAAQPRRCGQLVETLRLMNFLENIFRPPRAGRRPRRSCRRCAAAGLARRQPAASFLEAVAARAHFSATPASSRRPLRPARPQQYPLGRPGPGDHGRRAHRRPALRRARPPPSSPP